jgi:hypothetical protein
MLRIGRHFQFDAPDGWQESREGARWVYHGPEGEELIVSGYFAGAGGSLLERRAFEEQLLANAMSAARKASTQEGFVSVIPLKPDEAVTEVRCWTFVSETRDKDAVFAGSVANGEGGTLLVTIEGAYGPEPLAILRKFLKSLRRPTH